MKRRIYSVIILFSVLCTALGLVWCTGLCNAVYAADGWPNSAIGNTNTTSGGKGVRIAVIDTGISTNAIAKERIAEGKKLYHWQY